MTGPRTWWRCIPPERRRAIVYVALVALVAWGLLQQQRSTDELHDLVHAEEAEEQVERAEACVSSHERYAEVRRVIRNATVAGADLGAGAVAAVAGASPDQLAEGQAYIEAHADDVLGPIVATYEPPSCDLEDAAALLGRPVPASTLPFSTTTSTAPSSPPASPATASTSATTVP